MTHIRFERVRDVIDAFPSVAFELDIEPGDEGSLDFLSSLAGGGSSTRRSAFAPTCCRAAKPCGGAAVACASSFSRDRWMSGKDSRLAEEWVSEPEEDRRMAALELGMRHNSKLATTHLALAAGWSGRSFSIAGGDPVPIQPHATARSVRAAILIAAGRASPAERPELMRGCVEDGIRIAVDGMEQG